MSAFTRERSLPIAARELEFQEFRHDRTGARHVHLACDDPLNAFLVGFLTPAPDSTGVAHVVEHLVLCGSRRFPVGDLFFAMRRRSLATGMNALSSDDYTAFHFCTQYRSDFANLLDVYLDSVFFPRLRPLDFAREAYRVELEDPENQHSPLRYGGVILSEMQGAMCVPEIRLWTAIKQRLFGNTAYRHNSGGDPERLVELDHARVVEFHASHYHPSNAVLMTYGDAPAKEHQAQFQSFLDGFGYRQPVDAIEDKPLLPGPKHFDVDYPAAGVEPGQGGAQVALAWPLGYRSKPMDYIEARVLEELLFGHPGAPLRQALAGTRSGRSAAGVCSLHASTRRLVLVYAMDDCALDASGEVEALVQDTLRATAKSPQLGHELDTAMIRVVLEEQEVRADKVPYGLRLLKRMLPALMDGADPAELLDLTAGFARFEERRGDQRQAADWIEHVLNANPHRVSITLNPDGALAQAGHTRQREQLAAMEHTLDDDLREAIAEQSRLLDTPSDDASETDSLPVLATDELSSRTNRDFRLARHNKVHFFSTCTNELVYLHLLVALPAMDPALLAVLGLYRASIPLLGRGLGTAGLATTPGSRADTIVRASLSMQTRVSRLDAVDSYLTLSGKTLAPRLEDLSASIWEVFTRPCFGAQRLRQIIVQLHADAQRELIVNGHLIAQRAAGASTGPCGAMVDSCAGLDYVRRIAGIHRRLQHGHDVEALVEQLANLCHVLQRCRCQAFCVGEEDNLELAIDTLQREWVLKDQPLGKQPQSTASHLPERIPTLWLVDSPVGFCARAYKTVPEGHEDVAALMVLAALLENVVLYPAVRGAGGAYGTGAGYCRDTGAFRLFSYRDPRLGMTLRSFDAAATHATREPCSDTQLVEARMGALRTLESVESLPELALQSLIDACHGRFSQHQRKLRTRILSVDGDSLAEVAARYLRPELANSVVITSQHIATRDPYPGLHVRAVSDAAE